MSYASIQNLKDDVSAILLNLNLNNVSNLNGTLERSAKELATKIYIPESTGKSQVTLYDGVTDYISPTDIFGAGVVDFRPQGTSRTSWDFVSKQPIDIFDRTKNLILNGYQLAFEFIKGVGRLRIVSTRPVPKIELDPFYETTGWVLGGSASGLTQDSTVFWKLPSSLRFTLTGASSGTLTKTIPRQDFTNYVGVGVVFLAIRTPSASNLTSIAVKIGTDASNYYSASTTTGFLGAWTAGEWLLVAIDLSTATTTGTPTLTNIVYSQITITHGATLTNFYIGGFWVSLPSPHDLIYSSDAIFYNSAGSPSHSITNDNDSVILNDAAYIIYEHICAINIANQQGGTPASGLISELSTKLNGVRGYRGVLIQPGLLDLYRANNPSAELRTVGNYYSD